MTWGITPNITSCNALAPVARTPSTGPGSIASTASANSLANTPVVPRNSASVPAKGPRPTATTNNIAKTISLMERNASISRRTGWQIHQGTRLDEDSMPSGIPKIIASTVPQTAIWIVINISRAYMRHSEKSGGKKSAANVAILPESVHSRTGFISAPFQAQARNSRNSPHPSIFAQVMRGGCAGSAPDIGLVLVVNTDIFISSLWQPARAVQAAIMINSTYEFAPSISFMRAEILLSSSSRP